MSTGEQGRGGEQDGAGLLLTHRDIRELAEAAGTEPPADSAAELEQWMRESADSGSLERYLQTFSVILEVLQSAEALRRAAREAVEDLAADGVIHAELRWAPEQHVAGGLSLGQAVDAVSEGLQEGVVAAAQGGLEISAGQLLCAMRQADRSLEIAQLTIERFSPDEPGGVLGFDLAGPEEGFAPRRHQEALDLLACSLVPVTLHAGEGAGLDSLRSAVVDGRALRLGHGVRIVDDIEEGPDGAFRLGRVANIVRDKRIPLEMCPSSNVQTGAAPSIEGHPFDLLARLRFRVTVNTDNRLMSDTTMSHEMLHLVNAFGYGWSDLQRFTINAMKSAFLPFDERLAIIDDVIKPGFAVLIG